MVVVDEHAETRSKATETAVRFQVSRAGFRMSRIISRRDALWCRFESRDNGGPLLGTARKRRNSLGLGGRAGGGENLIITRHLATGGPTPTPLFRPAGAWCPRDDLRRGNTRT